MEFKASEISQKSITHVKGVEFKASERSILSIRDVKVVQFKASEMSKDKKTKEKVKKWFGSGKVL